MLQRAAEAAKEIAVRLTPDQVMLLLRDALQGDREKSRELFAQLEQRTHAVAVLNRTVTLQNFEQDGFGAALLQMDKPRLDATLAQLAQQEQRRLARVKPAELERRRPGWRNDRGRDFERD